MGYAFQVIHLMCWVGIYISVNPPSSSLKSVPRKQIGRKFIDKFLSTSAERCSSGKVNPNDSMGTGIDDDCGTKKPPKKGRKIKLTSNGSILLLDKKLVVFIYFTYCHECLHDASCILIILMWNIFLLIHCFLTVPSMLWGLLPWHLIDQKVHIKLKAKSQSENKNIANGFELDNVLANKVQPIGSTIDQSKHYFLSPPSGHKQV